MTTILVIEDEHDVRNNLRDILEQEGYQTHGAEEGQRGIEMARELLPDLIICDVMMPRLDGYGVVTELRSDTLTATIPFIFLTAKTLPDDQRKGMIAGADDYIIKPFKINDLLATIENQLKKHQSYFKKVDELVHTLTIAVPHELRTPLTSIVGYSQILTSPSFVCNPEEIVAIGESINNSAMRLSHLIDNYLLYFEFHHSMGDLGDRMRQSDIHSIRAADVQDFCEHKASLHKREHDLVMELSSHPCSMSYKVFMKILDELLDNAIKFSRSGSPIRIKTEFVDQKFVVQVKDQGNGMKPEHIQGIGAFKQFDRDIYEQQGLGLGLYLTMKLARCYEGTMVIDSQYMIGTTVSVIFAQPLNINWQSPEKSQTARPDPDNNPDY